MHTDHVLVKTMQPHLRIDQPETPPCIEDGLACLGCHSGGEKLRNAGHDSALTCERSKGFVEPPREHEVPKHRWLRPADDGVYNQNMAQRDAYCAKGCFR